MDKTDLEIARIITENSRVSSRKIANQLGISTKNVIKRHEKLKDVLVFPSIVLNLQKLGYEGWAYFYLTTEHNINWQNAKQQILLIPNLVIFIRLLGKYNALTGGPFIDFEDLQKMKNSLSKIEGIIEIAYVFDRADPFWPPNFFSKIIQKELETTKNR